MISIGPLNDYVSQQKYELNLQDTLLLLIYHDETHYLIENKCGHFGMSLATASISKNIITCNGHGISFDLNTGEISNRPYEICDPIVIHKLVIRENFLFWDR